MLTIFIKVKTFYVEKFLKNEDFASISAEIDHPYTLHGKLFLWKKMKIYLHFL